MTLLLDVAYAVALLLAAPLLLYRQWRRRGAGSTVSEYFGRIPSRKVAARCVWIHGVSLGEINATRNLVAELRRRQPEWAVVVSSTTQTGLARARELYHDLLVFRFPLDFSFAVRRVLKRVRPSIIVLMELEVWPNLIELATVRQIPVLIANGRVTADKSMRGFSMPIVRSVARRMFRQIAWVGAQEDLYAERFTKLGVPADRIEVTSSLKYDAADIADSIAGQEQLADDIGIDTTKPLWVCGSTGSGEEEMLLAAYARALHHVPQLQLVLVPRKPERFDAVARTIADAGFACVRRSGSGPPPAAAASASGSPPGAAASPGAPSVFTGIMDHSSRRVVFLGDTMGELRKFYALADAVFVGRTLAPLGGSDFMEIAGLAKPMLAGPHVDNFAEAAELLRAAGAIVDVSDVDTLAAALVQLLSDSEERRRMGLAARAAIIARRGATERTVRRIVALCEQAV